MKNIKFQIPFRTGDVVTFNANGLLTYGNEPVGAKNSMVVDRASMHLGNGTFSYSTTEGAWFNHEHLELVRPADLESLQQLFDFLTSEDADEEDDLTIDVG